MSLFVLIVVLVVDGVAIEVRVAVLISCFCGWLWSTLGFVIAVVVKIAVEKLFYWRLLS